MHPHNQTPPPVHPHGHTHSHGHPHGQAKTYVPRLVAWEVTRRCNLKCKHCRAMAMDKPYPGEFNTQECFQILDNIRTLGQPIIILTGGEPMYREDIYDIAAYGTKIGLRMVLAPCGHSVTPESVHKMKESGIMRISLSLDGYNAEMHDHFRQVAGSYDSIINACHVAKEHGMEFQINTTITKHNYKDIEKIFNLAVELGAVGYHPFLLVPTGRGKEMADMEITPEEYENVLRWFYENSRNTPIHLKPTCAPHYYRIFRQLEKENGRTVTPETHGLDAMTKGCMGGQSFAFISHVGKVQICGFLETEAGDLRQNNLDFAGVWNHSQLFQEMRNLNEYHGRCGVCEYRMVCGGCRARANATTGHYLDEEPYCVYEPAAMKKEKQQ